MAQLTTRPTPSGEAPTSQSGSRSGEPTDGPLTFDELGLAFRNRGMALEAMAHDTTPVGLQYLVIHWDIPVADATGWRVAVDRAVGRALTLSMDDIRSRPRTTIPVSVECAGNGRARLDPIPISVPWRHGHVVCLAAPVPFERDAHRNNPAARRRSRPRHAVAR